MWLQCPGPNPPQRLPASPPPPSPLRAGPGWGCGHRAADEAGDSVSSPSATCRRQGHQDRRPPQPHQQGTPKPKGFLETLASLGNIGSAPSQCEFRLWHLLGGEEGPALRTKRETRLERRGSPHCHLSEGRHGCHISLQERGPHTRAHAHIHIHSCAHMGRAHSGWKCVRLVIVEPQIGPHQPGPGVLPKAAWSCRRGHSPRCRGCEGSPS